MAWRTRTIGSILRTPPSSRRALPKRLRDAFPRKQPAFWPIANASWASSTRGFNAGARGWLPSLGSSSSPIEIRPRIIIGDERDPSEGSQPRAPALKPRVELAQEAFAIGQNAGCFRGNAARKRFGNARRDDGGVLRIEPIVRVRHAMGVAALVHDTLAADLQ